MHFEVCVYLYTVPSVCGCSGVYFPTYTDRYLFLILHDGTECRLLMSEAFGPLTGRAAAVSCDSCDSCIVNVRKKHKLLQDTRISAAYIHIHIYIYRLQ